MQMALHVQQASIAKIEKRTYMSLSTLRSYIESMGGQLEVVARRPVNISNFTDLGNVSATSFSKLRYLFCTLLFLEGIAEICLPLPPV